MTKCLAVCALATVLFGCHHSNQTAAGSCHIEGTLPTDEYNGKRIFLVPLYGPKTAEYVDSIEIKDRKFHFDKDTVGIYKILMDYHYRFGTQELLVITEPGQLDVHIDSISSGRGTPQNDSLQAWKSYTEQYGRRIVTIRQMMEAAQQQGNEALATQIKAHGDSIHQAYKLYTRQLAAALKGSLLGDFLAQRFPKTYRKQLPDGTYVTINADTNEVIEQ